MCFLFTLHIWNSLIKVNYLKIYILFKNTQKLLVWMALSFLSSYGITFLRSPTVRYIYSFVFGFGINYFMYENTTIHPIIMLVLTYGIMISFKREKQQAIVFGVIYSYQSLMHIERMVNHYGEWGAEITNFTMNLVCRLISLGFWYKDGLVDSSRGGFPNDKAVKKLPSFLQVAGYTYNVPSWVAGPFFEYKDYEDWIELKGSYSKIPSALIPGLKRFGTGCIWILCGITVMKYYSVEYLRSDEYWSSSIFMKPFHHYFFVYTLAFSYYVAWAFNDAACIISGLAYNGYDEKSKSHMFNRIFNVNEFALFKGYHLPKMVSNWNASIAVWLKKYVYNRLSFHNSGDTGFKQFFFTFIVSAFWHGFYPGYYFFFFYMGIFIHFTGIYRRYYSWYFRFIPSILQKVIGCIIAYQFTTYVGAVFAIYAINDIIFYFNWQYWYGHFLLLSVVLIHVSPIGKVLVAHAKKMKEIESAKSGNDKADKTKESKKKK